MTVRMVAERGTGRLLGAQIIGGPGLGQAHRHRRHRDHRRHDRRRRRRPRPRLRPAVLVGVGSRRRRRPGSGQGGLTGRVRAGHGRTSPTGSPPTATATGPSSPAATASSSPGPARGRTGRSSCAACSGSSRCCRWASAGPSTTSAAGRSTSTPAGATRCSASRGCRRPTSPASRTTTGASPCRRSSTSPTGQVVTNDFAPAHARPLDRVARPPPPRRARPLPASAAATRSTRSSTSSTRTSTTASTAAGSPATQAPYEQAYRRLFARLDWLSERLVDQRYLVGDTITEADVRLFTTLARFDAVYHGHFKCNRQKLTEMPVLWAYARDLFQTPGFGDTIDVAQIKRHYYVVHRTINPTGHRARRPGPRRAGWLAARSRGARRPAVRRRDAAGPADPDRGRRSDRVAPSWWADRSHRAGRPPRYDSSSRRSSTSFGAGSPSLHGSALSTRS